jgi:hypothetical protein
VTQLKSYPESNTAAIHIEIAKWSNQGFMLGPSSSHCQVSDTISFW